MSSRTGKASPPRPEGHIRHWNDNYKRARSMTPWQLTRSVLLRTEPTSSLLRAYYRRRLSSEQWTQINRQAKEAHQRNRGILDNRAMRIVRGLQKYGVQTITAERLFGDDRHLVALRSDAEKILKRREQRKQIQIRESYDGAKWYVIRALGLNPRGPLPNSIANLALDDRILAIVNSYLGLSCRMLYADLWYNLAARPGEPPIDSEHWHRDNEDVKILKLFFYLDEVNAGTGPLSYIRGTQPGGAYADVFPAQPPQGSYPPESQLRRMIPTDQIKVCTGKAGTLVLYDASGIHRGGRATDRPRRLMVATYASDAAIDPIRYRLLDETRYSRLSPAARYAIRAE